MASIFFPCSSSLRLMSSSIGLHCTTVTPVMQIPKRRSEMLSRAGRGKDESNYMTAAAVERMKRTILDLEAQRPKAVEDLSRAREMGDLSENAAYTEAKARL